MIKKNYLIFLICFSAINLLLYFFILNFYNLVQYSKFDYINNAHHYLPDERINGGKFNFFRSLGQYDAQWYLKIANSGYPNDSQLRNLSDKSIMDGKSYAFFPLYPALLRIMNNPFENIELTAFIFASILLLLNFTSLYYVISRIYKENIAIKTIFLIFLFPFSIFFRSYFTEALFLFGLIWFAYFFIKRKWLASSLILGLLLITRPAGLFLLPVFFYFIYKQLISHKMSFVSLVPVSSFAFAPFIIWMFYCFIQTGDALYFYIVQSKWSEIRFPLIHNLELFAYFSELPIHSFHYSQLDIVTILLTGSVIFFSKKYLRRELWLISLALFVGPLLTTDTMSYTRFQIISFPLFLYLAQILKGWKYWAVILLFGVGLFFVSVLFVNWYWIG